MRAHTLSFSCTHTRTPSLVQVHTHSLTHNLYLCQTHTHTLSLSHSIFQARIHFLKHVVLSHTLSLKPAHTLSHCLSLSQARTLSLLAWKIFKALKDLYSDLLVPQCSFAHNATDALTHTNTETDRQRVLDLDR